MFEHHFGINKKLDIPPKDQLAAMQNFVISSVDKPFNRINLMVYIDRCGTGFLRVQIKPHQKLAHAMFENLSSPDKLSILQYAEWYDDGKI